VIFGVPALFAIAIAIAIIPVMLGSAPGVNARQTRPSVHARPNVRAEQGKDVYVDELRKGECVARPIPEGDISTVKVGPCSQPHREDVYAVFDLAPGHFTRQGMVDRRGDAGCRRRFAKYVGIDFDSSELDYFALTPYVSALPEDREVECIVVDIGRHTGNLEGVRR
jgi:hypothetical protein